MLRWAALPALRYWPGRASGESCCLDRQAWPGVASLLRLLGQRLLVHGGFVDGSGWQAVHDPLTKDGYRVAIVQNPPLSLEDDAAVTRRVIDDLDDPTVLVGTPTAER